MLDVHGAILSVYLCRKLLDRKGLKSPHSSIICQRIVKLLHLKPNEHNRAYSLAGITDAEKKKAASELAFHH